MPWRSDGNIHTKLAFASAVCLNLMTTVDKAAFEPTGYLRAIDPAFVELIVRLKRLGKL